MSIRTKEILSAVIVILIIATFIPLGMKGQADKIKKTLKVSK